MVGKRGATVTDGAVFARTLEALKRDGCNVLLVGAETKGAHTALCQRLRGETNRESRYRLFVTADHEHGRDDGVSPNHDSVDDRIRTITYSTPDVTADTACDDHRGRRSETGERTLEAVGMDVADTIDAFDTAAGGLEPSELRVCIDSLGSVLQTHDEQAVFQFLQLTTSRTERVNGIGHVHLPLERDHDLVRLFEPLFDGLVEVRTRGDSHEQRWQLVNGMITTDWISL